MDEQRTGGPPAAPTLVEPSPETTPSPPRRGRVVIAVVAAVAVVAGVVAFVMTRGGPTALALSYSTGQQVSWHMTMDENLTMSFGAQSIPLQARMSAALTWHVASVDGNGTATIEMRFDHASVEANGQTQSLDLPTSTFRLTSDGRMLTSTGATLFSGAPGGQFMGGGSQVSAILPDHPVAPGDTWSKHQSMTLFGNPVSFDSKATFLRTEQFKGVAASVVRTTDSVPMTLSLNLADFAGTFGFTQDQVPAGSRADYELQVAGDTTSWIDAANKRLLQTAGTAHVSGTFTITGMPGVPADPIGMQGTVSMKLIAA